MPNLKSAKKAMRQSRARHGRNKAQRSELRTALKAVRAAGAAASAELAAKAYSVAARLLDRAARKGLIHKNNAARHKSRLAALVKRIGAK